MFPGWHVWYTAGSDTWNAHREERETILRPLPVRQRTGIHGVALTSAPALVALAGTSDPATCDELPDWREANGLGLLVPFARGRRRPARRTRQTPLIEKLRALARQRRPRAAAART